MQITWFAPFREAIQTGNGDSVEVVLFTAGCGNRIDRNYYSPEVVAAAAPVFDGAKCFVDHPTQTEEEDRPERTMRDVCGWFSNVRAVGDANNMGLRAVLNFGGPAADIAREASKAAIQYQMQYKASDKVFAGFSINAEGSSHEDGADDLIKRYPQFADAFRNAPEWNVVDGIAKAMSADLVTFPARGGRILSMREAERQLDSKRWRLRLREAESKTWRQHLREAFGQSLDMRVQSIRDAFSTQFNAASGCAPMSSTPWINDVFDDHVIVQENGQYFSVPYATDENGTTFAMDKKQLVERVWQPVADGQRTKRAA